MYVYMYVCIECVCARARSEREIEKMDVSKIYIKLEINDIYGPG